MPAPTLLRLRVDQGHRHRARWLTLRRARRAGSTSCALPSLRREVIAHLALPTGDCRDIARSGRRCGPLSGRTPCVLRRGAGSTWSERPAPQCPPDAVCGAFPGVSRSQIPCWICDHRKTDVWPGERARCGARGVVTRRVGRSRCGAPADRARAGAAVGAAWRRRPGPRV